MNVISAVARPTRILGVLLLAVVVATCGDEMPLTPVTPPSELPPGKGLLPAGTYEFTVTGIGTNDIQASAQRVVFDESGHRLPAGAQASLDVVSSGLTFELTSASSFTEGKRTEGGERYLTFTYRVKNTTGGSLTNLTLIPNSTASTISGTPWLSLKLFNGTDASATIAPNIVPTGAVALGEDFSLKSLYPDVLQAFTEAEVAAITPPPGVTSIFPYGFVVRNRLNLGRTITNAVDANDYAGVLTFSFRFPLQATAGQDPFSLTFLATSFQDTETRITESIEEGQDTGAVRRLRDRATLLAVTTTTVMNGSTIMDPAVPDYPGLRQICSVRTAGTAGSPATLINAVGPYAQLMLLNPGESVDSCAAYFRAGSPGRPATNVAYAVGIRAMDRYGNVKNINETIRLQEDSGPPATVDPSVALSAGVASRNITFSDYGTANLSSVADRMRGTRTISVFGITRTWTAGAGTTDWHTGTNWDSGAVPMLQDSVYIPVAAPLDPVLAANVQVEGVTVEDVATLNIGAFNLTATANVTAGLTGGITNTSGSLILAGTARTIQGKVPRLRVTGTYSLTGNVTARAPIQVDAGRITASAFRLQADSN